MFSLIILLQFNTKIYYNINTSIIITLNSALFIKLGAAPFHFWFPEVISGLNWNNSLILLTWQKIAPIILIIYNLTNLIFLSLIIITSSLIRGIQNFNQTNLRKILAYSSINHISWIIARIINSFSVWLTYFIFYIIVTFNIVLIFKNFNIFFLNQLYITIINSKLTKFFFILNFLSLRGLPPFLGFLPKWLTLNSIIYRNFFILGIFIVIFTLIRIYIYLRITFATLTLNSQETLLFFYQIPKFSIIIVNLVTLRGLLRITLLYVN